MSKAFDSLHPPLLLSKLRAYRFRDSAVQLRNSYLCDRRYCVKIENTSLYFSRFSVHLVVLKVFVHMHTRGTHIKRHEITMNKVIRW